MIQYLDNELSAEDFRALRVSDNWAVPACAQAEAAIAHSLICVTARKDGRAVGMGRLVGDGALIWYIQDVIVLPEYQGQGIGRRIVERLIEHVRATRLPGTQVTVGLMAAFGKEGFYEKLGFRVRPNAHEGPGMAMNLQGDAP